MIQIDGNQLTITQVVSVARYGEQATLSDHARQRMIQSHTWVQGIVSAGRPVYGINTGFGIFAEQSISAADSTRLTRNLILSHCVPPLRRFRSLLREYHALARSDTI